MKDKAKQLQSFGNKINVKSFKAPKVVASLTESEKAYFKQLITSHKQKDDDNFVIGGKVFGF